MKKILLATVLGCCAFGAVAQTMSTTHMTQEKDKKGAALPSPRMETSAMLGKAKITISYGSPSLKGREMSALVPAGKIWRLGANEATSLISSGDLMIGTQHVPAGSYTLFIMPTESGWMLAINKQTGQWGLTYDESQDLGRVQLKSATLPSSQEKLSIDIEQIKGGMGQLHIKWGTVDASTMIMAH